MDQAVLNDSRLGDAVASLGWMNGDDYVISPNCLNSLENLEVELGNEDAMTRDVRLYLGRRQVVQKDLIPIMIDSKDRRINVAVTRLLVNLTSPVDCLLPLQNCNLTLDMHRIVTDLQNFLLASSTAFLDAAATSSVVNALREEILNCEKYHIPLSEARCEHLKNCLLLLRNIIHYPEGQDSLGTSKDVYSEWQSVHSKIVWNLFVQGLDGALLLMLNSKYKAHWTLPLAQIIALLYKDQNISRVEHSLELVSSTSESAEDDEESDGSKNSFASLSSEPVNSTHISSDSGCPASSDSCFTTSLSTEEEIVSSERIKTHSEIVDNQDEYNSEINAKFKNFSIQDTDEDVSMESASDYSSGSETQKLGRPESNSSESNVVIKFNNVLVNSVSVMLNDKLSSSDDNCVDKKAIHKTIKAQHKHKSAHLHLKMSESDSSTDGKWANCKNKPRNYPPVSWKGKGLSSKKSFGCAPSVCIEAALSAANNRGRLKYPLWEKRNSVSVLLDKKSSSPSEEEVGNLLKDFTLSFLHSGFKSLILDLQMLLSEGIPLTIGKEHFLWLLSYFLYFAKTFRLNLRHINDILSVKIIGYLTFECICACEEIEMHIVSSVPISKYLLRRLHLLVMAFKEVILTINTYSMRAVHQKDKDFFHKLFCALAEMQEVRQLPLLLLHSYHSSYHMKQYLEDVVTLNHYLLIFIEKGSEECWQPKKINIFAHLKQFACQRIVQNYGRLLEDFKTNSFFLNDCVFTMLHHVAGDICAPQLLMQPLILKIFSNILREDFELQPYWEDLIMFILNKFSQQVEKRKFHQDSQLFKEKEVAKQGGVSVTCTTCRGNTDNSSISSNSVLSEEEADDDDELFWWYLQFETDDDPISRISEHTLTSTQDILQRLLLKGVIAKEKYDELERKEKKSDDAFLKPLTLDEPGNIITNADDEINQLLRKLVQSGHHQHITWLQDNLLETCASKLNVKNYFVEPVPFYSTKMMISVPVVPYSDDQKAVLQDETFTQLLQKLGFHLGSDIGRCYPRIPALWSPDTLYSVAAHLGPIKKEKLKFTTDDLLNAELSFFSKKPSEILWLSSSFTMHNIQYIASNC